MNERAGGPVIDEDPSSLLGIDDLVDADFLDVADLPATLASGSEVHDLDALGRQAQVDALLASYLLDVDEPPVDDP